MRGERMETEYVLSSKEMAILLSAAGCDGFYGFSLAEAPDMDTGELLRELHSLYQKGFLRQKDGVEKLEISPELLSLLRACSISRYVLRISAFTPELIPFAACCHGEDGWTVMRPCGQLPDGWLLQGKDTAGIISLLEEYGLLPYPDDDLQRAQEKLPSYTVEEAGKRTPLVHLEWIDGKAGIPMDAVTVSRGILTDWIETTAEQQPYMSERLHAWIESGHMAWKMNESEVKFH